jgi:hypothetical protein
MVYDLPVEEEKVKPHQITTLHMVCALAFMGAGAIIFRYNFDITTWGLALLLAGIALVLVTMIKNKWLISNKINPVVRILEAAIAAWMAVYSVMQHWKFPAGIFGVLTAVVLFAIYWERPADRKLAITVDDEGIKLPVTSRKRFIPWTEVEQVLIRFGTLTIDCVQNRLFQWTVPEPQFDPEIFEAWCAARVEENRSKRRTDDEW